MAFQRVAIPDAPYVPTKSKYRDDIDYHSLDCQGVPVVDNDATIVGYLWITCHDTHILPFARVASTGVFQCATMEDALDFSVPATCPSIFPVIPTTDPRIWQLIDTPEQGLVYVPIQM